MIARTIVARPIIAHMLKRRLAGRAFARAAALILYICATLAALPADAVEIRDYRSPAGIGFWMVEDYTVPIVTLAFDFRGGASQDPEGKAGLASLLSAMMDEGAGERSTAQLKQALEERGIEAGFSAGRDAVSGGMRVLAGEAEPAYALLADMLLRPRFEPASLERIRAGYIQSAVRARKDPDAVIRDTFREMLFAGHPYGRDVHGDETTLAAITRQDIVAQHRRLMARDNLVIGLVGAVSPQEAGRLIDLAFAGLPAKAELMPVADVAPQLGFARHIAFPAPQASVVIAYPGVKRSDPDFFTAYTMNHILGGGTFSSRLYDEIREKRGLVYGVGSDLVTLAHAAYLSGGFSTRPDQAADALALMQSEIGRMAQEGPTGEELEAARKYILGAYAINNLDTSSKIADVLVALQAEGLPIDYIDRRRDSIEAVTLEGVRAMAKRLLSAQPAVITIGAPVPPTDAAAD
ncbi:MAG: insulinase family protein [Nitratireductor sp.]|nr:insulinase family protein [Nitratireductor sp.]